MEKSQRKLTNKKIAQIEANMASQLDAELAYLETKEDQYEIATQWINFYEQQYQETLESNRKDQSEKVRKQSEPSLVLREVVGNPLWAWRGILECLNSGIDFPAGLRQYLKDVAFAVCVMSQDPKKYRNKNLDELISEIFGFKKRGKLGRGNILSRFDREDMNLACGVRLERLRGADFLSAYKYVAKEQGTSEATVRRAWKKHKRFLEKIQLNF